MQNSNSPSPATGDDRVKLFEAILTYEQHYIPYPEQYCYRTEDVDIEYTPIQQGVVVKWWSKTTGDDVDRELRGDQLEAWLRSMAAKGGKGGVDNVDARALGRVADHIATLKEALDEIANCTTGSGIPEVEYIWKIARAAKDKTGQTLAELLLQSAKEAGCNVTE